MSFDAHEQRLKDIFSGDSSFHIPRNQRDYVWEEKNWKELADDVQYVFSLISNKKDLSHFIGSFVFQKVDDEYIIIDGQQRITTLMIMLASICVLHNEINDHEGFGLTKQYLIGNIGLKAEFQRLKNDTISNLKYIIGRATNYCEERSKDNIFKDIPFDRTKKSNKLIVSCFWFFYNYFAELSKSNKDSLNTIRSIIVEMKVIHIISENELDCYEVFEILNARGVSLKDSELMKNYIFKYVQPESTVDIAKAKWDKILENMTKCKDNIEQFLVHYFTARFPKVKTQKDSFFQLVKERIPKNEINALLDELVKCSELYTYFYEPDSYPDPIICDVLKFFILENQRQFRPIFIAYFLAHNKKLINETELQKAFILIRNFYFSYGLICKNGSNLIENSVYSLANEIYLSTNNVTVRMFFSKFYDYYPSEETFIAHFSEKGYSNKNKLYTNSKNKKEIDYILRGFEQYYQSEQGAELQCNLAKCNVEHINSDSEIKDTYCKIGNLLLISETINSNIGNIPFSEKVKEYKKSKLLNVCRFVENYGNNEDFTDSDINKRSTKLAKLAFNKIWLFKVQ